jgi:hypothetical protein
MISQTKGHTGTQMISKDLIDHARTLLVDGRQDDALSVFMQVGQSLPLYSTDGFQHDPVIDAVRLPVSFEKLSDKELLVYAAWVHHALLQLIVAKQTWTTNVVVTAAVNHAVERFCSYIQDNQIKHVLDSGYFLAINTLLNVAR